uniref:GNAT family N-acetyltransferase n=1 Tax=Nonlabens sp. Ci31 TaxID=2608253 RepID=UPI00198232B9
MLNSGIKLCYRDRSETFKACFEAYQLYRVEAGCAVENHASKRVLEKCGFVVEGIQERICL